MCHTGAWACGPGTRCARLRAVGDASTWATVWPVITCTGGIAATQALEFAKARRQDKKDKESRRDSVCDQRLQYEIPTLTDTHTALSELY